MATITIRGLDDDIKLRLEERAREHGRSMEAEVRVLLATALSTTTLGFGSRFRERYAALGGVEIEPPARTEPPRAATFE
jgi:plasmid stability protein